MHFHFKKINYPRQNLKIRAFLKRYPSKISLSKANQFNLINKNIREDLIYSYLHKLKAMLNYNSITIGQKLDLEISHHKGIENFEKVGCFLFNIINEEYAKKLLVMLPNQSHPVHHHKLKKEFFNNIWNYSFKFIMEKKFFLKSGDVFHIEEILGINLGQGKMAVFLKKYRQLLLNRTLIIKVLRFNHWEEIMKTYINNWFTIKNSLENG